MSFSGFSDTGKGLRIGAGVHLAVRLVIEGAGLPKGRADGRAPFRNAGPSRLRVGPQRRGPSRGGSLRRRLGRTIPAMMSPIPAIWTKTMFSPRTSQAMSTVVTGSKVEKMDMRALPSSRMARNWKAMPRAAATRPIASAKIS